MDLKIKKKIHFWFEKIWCKILLKENIFENGTWGNNISWQINKYPSVLERISETTKSKTKMKSKTIIPNWNAKKSLLKKLLFWCYRRFYVHLKRSVCIMCWSDPLVMIMLDIWLRYFVKKLTSFFFCLPCRLLYSLDNAEKTCRD